MDSPLQEVFYGVTEKMIGYLPNLVAGIVLIGIGWLLAWLAKRIVVQLLAVLRFDKLLRRFQWGTSLAKADVRFAFFEFIGNIAFLTVFLVLLNAALQALQLNALSIVLQRGVDFIPRILISLLIIGIGWMFAGWIAKGVQQALMHENVPRATLISRFAKSVIMLFFSAMALAELDIAREIVVIGFSATIITLGILSIVLTTIGGKTFVAKILERLEE